MRTAPTLLTVLIALQQLHAQAWRTPIPINIPAKFDINLRGVPSQCYQVIRPADGRITAEVIGPGDWNLCVGHSNCPYDCMGGGRRTVSTEPLTTGTHYYVMAERTGGDAMASLEIYPTAMGRQAVGRRAIAALWTAVIPQKNFRRGGYKISQNGTELILTSWDGKSTPAYWKDDSTIVADGWRATGKISEDGKRIDWSNGGYWESTGWTSNMVSIIGSWTAVIPQRNFRRGGYRISQNGSQLTLVSWDGKSTSAYMKDQLTIVAEGWNATGKISANGKRIDWSNGGYWER